MLLSMAIPASVWAGYYDKVRSGDTLESFASRNKVSAAQVRAANRLPSPTKLSAGVMLYVPRERTTTPPPAPVTKSTASGGAGKPAASSPPSSSGLYTVKPGDSLSAVANRNGITTSELAKANGLSPTAMLSIGQRLRIPPPTPKESPSSTPSNSSDSRPAPSNGGGSSGRIERDIPGGGTDPDSLRPSRRGFVWPVEGRVVRRFANNSREKSFGINIAAPLGTDVRAARDGVVTYSKDSIKAYGRMVIIEHDDGLASCYAHNRRLVVREGERVRQGQVIAEVGDSGRGGTPALHFEIRRRGVAVNPEEYLP